MAFGTKTNERPGTRASVRYLRVSAYKAREVLDLIRGLHVDDADGILEFTDRAVAADIRKVLASAVANAEKNDEIDPNELFVSACYADEGPTLKRWRPRARGRATRIRKRTCHITLIVSRMGARELEQRRARTEAAVGRGGVRRDAAEARRARVAKSRAAAPSASADARPRPRGRRPHPRRGRQRRPDRGRRRGRRRRSPVSPPRRPSRRPRRPRPPTRTSPTRCSSRPRPTTPPSPRRGASRKPPVDEAARGAAGHEDARGPTPRTRRRS